MKNNLKKNIIYQTFYQILILIIPIVTSPYISRVLGAERLGIYSYTYSVAYYFTLIAALGINNHGSRVIAEVKNNPERLNQTFSDLFIVHLIISVFTLIAYLFYILFFVKENKLFAIIQIVYVISAIVDINWLFFGLEQFKLTVIRNALVKILTVICVFSFVKTPDDLWIYCLIMAMGFFVSQSIVWVFLKKYVTFVKPQWEGMKENILPMIILFIPAIAVSLYKIMDKIMLGNMCNKIQVGYYENSEKIINVMIGFISAFGTVMLPRMSNLFSQGKKELARYYMDLSIEVVMYISIPLSFGLAAVARTFAPIFFGIEFTECGYLITILAYSIPFIGFANVIRTQYLIPNHMDKVYLISVTSGAIINIVINFNLIPLMGARGAAIGTVCAEVLVCFVQTISIVKIIDVNKYVRYLSVFIISSVAMYFGIHITIAEISNQVIGLFICVVEGVFIYLIMTLSYLAITNDELWLLIKNKLIERKNGVLN